MEPANQWVPIQTGFLLFNPSLISHRYEEIVSIIKRGKFGGNGWENSGIGFFYGGATTAGVLTYMLAKDWGQKTIWDYARFAPADAVEVLKETLLNDNFASDGTGYSVTFPDWPFTEIQWLGFDEVNVCSRSVCRPRSSPLKAVSKIRSIHFTGAFEFGSLIKSDRFKDGDSNMANKLLAGAMIEEGNSVFPVDGGERFADCKGLFAILFARQLTLFYRIVKRTKLELWFLNQAEESGEEARTTSYLHKP
jgi:hypothetical protein